jgi:hypothetical protein
LVTDWIVAGLAEFSGYLLKSVRLAGTRENFSKIMVVGDRARFMKVLHLFNSARATG